MMIAKKAHDFIVEVFGRKEEEITLQSKMGAEKQKIHEQLQLVITNH